MSHILHSKSELFPIIDEPITAEIFRYDPSKDEEPRMETYVVPYRYRMSIFTLLREIYEKMDSTLAFRNQQCGRGICGTCNLRINKDGKPVKGCTITLDPGSHIIIKPYNIKKVIRDLVVEL
jgi:succinate dehydrogenase / fumarate reductase iron-sulfur subunit